VLEAASSLGPCNSPDVHRIQVGVREFIVIGTAHVSRGSVELVEAVIKAERPDAVCIELDQDRYQALSQPNRWERLDLKEVFRNRQLATLLINLLLASYQKRLGDQTGVKPGAELLAAARCAESLDIPFSLCDRNVRVTLRRAWGSVGFLRKASLLAGLIAALFDTTKISEEELARLKQADALSSLLEELGRELPEIKEVLIDERDIYLAEKAKEAAGDKVVLVVGAGHVEGVENALHHDHSRLLPSLETIPPPPPYLKIIGWLIPLVILGSLGGIGFRHGMSAAGQNLLFWILANGVPAAAGAALALAHPLTIATGFLAAPVTSLTPVIGAGYVTAFVQLMARPPLVREFEQVLDDMGTFKGWWSNRLLKIMLAFLLPGVGSMIGTWVGGTRIVSQLFG